MPTIQDQATEIGYEVDQDGKILMQSRRKGKPSDRVAPLVDQGQQQVSENFKLKEFFKFRKPEEILPDRIHPALIRGSQAARDKLGSEIVTRSGFRPPEHKIERVKPAGPGPHTRGISLDADAPGKTLREFYEAVKDIPEFASGGIGVYPEDGHLHFDVRGEVGQSPARWGVITDPKTGEKKEVSIDEALKHPGMDSLPSQSDTTQSYIQYEQEIEQLLARQHNQASPTQASLLGDLFDGLMHVDEVGRAEFAKVIARTGLAPTGVEVDDIPSNMTGDQLMTEVFGVDKAALDTQPFTYDRTEPLLPQVYEWVDGLVKLDSDLRFNITRELLGDAAGGLTLGGYFTAKLLKYFGKLRNLRRGNKEKTREQVQKQIAQIEADAEKLRDITENQAMLINFLKGRGEHGTFSLRSYEARVQTGLDNDIWTLDKLKSQYHLPNTPMGDAQAAVIAIRTNQFYDDTVVPLLKQLEKDPSEDNFNLALRAWDEMLSFEAPEIAGVSASARTEQAQQALTKLAADTRLANLKAAVEEGITSREAFAKQLLAVKSLAEHKILGEKLARPGAWKGYNELLMGGFLSGTGTWLGVNLTSSTALMLWWLAKHQIAGLTPGTPVKAHEAYRAAKAMVGAFKSEWKLLKQNIDQPTVRFGTKVKPEGLEVAENFTVLKADNLPTWLDPVKPALNRLGHIAGTFMRVAMAEDEFYKGLAYSGKLSMEADRVTQKLKGFDKLSTVDKIQKRNQILLDMHTHPERFPAAISRARKLTGEITLTSALSKSGEALVALTNSHPGLKTMTLFLRTSINDTKTVFREMPVIGQLRDVWQGKFTHRDPYIRAEAIAKMEAAGLFGLAVWQLAEDEILMPAESADPGARRAMAARGFRPGAIAGDTDGDGQADHYWAFATNTPMAKIARMVATVHSLSPYLSEGELQKFTTGLTLAVVEIIEDQGFIQSSGNLFDFADRINQGTGGDAVEEWVKRRGFDYVPIVGTTFSALRNEVTRTVDPVRRVVSGPLDELATYVDILKAKTPGASKFLLADRDIFGNPEIYAGGWGSRYQDSGAWTQTIRALTPGTLYAAPGDVREAAALHWLADQGRFPQRTDHWWDGVRLTNNQVAALNILAGKGFIGPEEGLEAYGVPLIPPQGEDLAGSMTDAMEKIIFSKADHSTLVEGKKGEFHFKKADLVMNEIAARRRKAYEVLLETPMFADVRQLQLLQELSPQIEKHSAPTQIRHKGIDLTTILP